MRKILDKCGVGNMLNVSNIVLTVFLSMMIFVLIMGNIRARASDKTISDLRQTVSDNDIYIAQLEEELAQMRSIQDATVKQYEDRIRGYERDIRKLNNKVDKLKQKKKEIQIKYQTVKTYLTKDEIWLANYISKGGTVEDAGIWYCTAYCTEKRKHICGTGTGITASGEPVEAFVSCALNRHNLKTYPFGTHIYIEGIGERVVMDTGGGVRQKQIDCAVDTHYNAVHWAGQGDHHVWILKND